MTTFQLDTLQRPVTPQEIIAYKTAHPTPKTYIGLGPLILTFVLIVLAVLAYSLIFTIGKAIAESSVSSWVNVAFCSLAFLVCLAALINNVRSQSRQVRRVILLARFAAANNLQYDAASKETGMKGSIGYLGNSTYVTDRISSTTKPAFAIGNYHYTIGGAGVAVKVGYVSVELSKTVPGTTVGLKNNTNEALANFTSDVQQLLSGYRKVEIVDNTLYIYKRFGFKLDQPGVVEQLLNIVTVVR